MIDPLSYTEQRIEYTFEGEADVWAALPPGSGMPPINLALSGNDPYRVVRKHTERPAIGGLYIGKILNLVEDFKGEKEPVYQGKYIVGYRWKNIIARVTGEASFNAHWPIRQLFLPPGQRNTTSFTINNGVTTLSSQLLVIRHNRLQRPAKRYVECHYYHKGVFEFSPIETGIRKFSPLRMEYTPVCKTDSDGCVVNEGEIMFGWFVKVRSSDNLNTLINPANPSVPVNTTPNYTPFLVPRGF